MAVSQPKNTSFLIAPGHSAVNGISLKINVISCHLYTSPRTKIQQCPQNLLSLFVSLNLNYPAHLELKETPLVMVAESLEKLLP